MPRIPSHTTTGEQLVVLTEEQIGCLSSPTRREMFDTLVGLGPSSVAEIAEALSLAPDALYYHIRALKSAGLVEETGMRSGRTRSEAIYEATTQLLIADPETSSESYLRSLVRMFDTMIRALLRRMERALLDSRIRRTGPERQINFRTLLVRLDEDDVKEFNERIEHLCEFLLDRSPDGPGQLYQVVMTSAPVDREDES